jgi:hypothetical protein
MGNTLGKVFPTFPGGALDKIVREIALTILVFLDLRCSRGFLGPADTFLQPGRFSNPPGNA